MEYFYMFSEGSYSDYCVGGLYKSKLKLTEEDFKVYKGQRVQEYLSSINLEYPDIDVDCGHYSLKHRIFTRVAGVCPQIPPYNLQVSIGPVRLERARRENYEWTNGLLEFFKANPLPTLTQWLCEKGTLEAIEYEEMHEIE